MPFNDRKGLFLPEYPCYSVCCSVPVLAGFGQGVAGVLCGGL